MTMANQTEYEEWNGENGRRWIADADRQDHVLQPLSDALLEAAGLQPGQSVLDVGCGCGATTIDAACIRLPVVKARRSKCRSSADESSSDRVVNAV